jgi:hypothetical protein
MVNNGNIYALLLEEDIEYWIQLKYSSYLLNPDAVHDRLRKLTFGNNGKLGKK